MPPSHKKHAGATRSSSRYYGPETLSYRTDATRTSQNAVYETVWKVAVRVNGTIFGSAKRPKGAISHRSVGSRDREMERVRTFHTVSMRSSALLRSYGTEILG